MKFVLVHISTSQPAWLREAMSEFAAKIDPLVPFEDLNLISPKIARKQSHAKVSKEGELIDKLISRDDFVVLFDERGKALDSISFSKKTNQVLTSGKKRALFIIGGAYGFTDEIRRRADLILNLAPFVLNHHVAQLVAAEQIYRSLTILKGLPYHNE